MLFKKGLVLLVCLIFMVTAFAGCGGAANDNKTTDQTSAEKTESLATSTQAAASQPTEITVWSWYGEQMKSALLGGFNQKYPDIKVNILTFQNIDVTKKLLTTLAAGSGAPDASCLEGNDVVKLIDNGGLADLTTYMASYKDSFPAYKLANDTGADGKIYACPIDCGPSALYYKKDTFDELGITMPMVTWDDWIAAGAKLKAKGLYLHRMSKKGELDLVRQWTQQQNASFFDKDGNPTLNTQEFKNSLQLMKKLYDSGAGMDVDQWTPPSDEAIKSGKITTIFSAAWYMNAFIHSFDSCRGWAVAKAPTFPGGAETSNLGGSEMVIPEQSVNKDAAWKFVEYYCASIDGKKAAMEGIGEFPAFLPVYKEESVQNKTLPYFGDQKTFAFFAELLPKVPNFKITSSFGEVTDMISAELPRVLAGEAIDGVAADIQKKAEVIANKYKK